MAAAPTNQFKTVTHTLTTNAVGIYTCPAGVSALVIYGNVANVGASSSVTAFTASLSRDSVDTPIVQLGRIPHQDSMTFIEGRLALEPGDILKISGDVANTQKCIVSILENAK
jgi:hypothetical protein|tara:strand:+ start:103 stop:441 length:339 start_codon:yes stop_codon:yes gene_type:complete